MAETYNPRPYQDQITNYILDNPRCAIWAAMGLGKTAATLEALVTLDIVEPGPTLIIAPLRVARTVWSDEIEKWSCFNHLIYARILGTVEERKKALLTKSDIFLVNFEQLTWLVEELGDKWPFTKVVVDEFSKMKGFRLRQGTRRARALAQHAHTKIKRLIGLTGTPASNGVVDLWGPTWFIDKGERLGRTFSAFSTRWFRPDYSGFGIIPMPHAQKEIEAKLSDVCLSLKAEDWFDLKEPIINLIKVKLPPKARDLYKKMEKELFVQIKQHSVEAFNAASMTVKVQQLAGGALYVEGSNEKFEEIHDEKIQALESIIEEAAGTPVLVAYSFRSDYERLKKRFPQGRALDAKSNVIKEWNEGNIPILFAHPQSAGHGLSLQHGGNIIAFFNISWNLEEHLQIIERIGSVRQMQSGYDRPVFIHYIIAENTIDEDVLERLRTKKSVQDCLLKAMRRRG